MEPARRHGALFGGFAPLAHVGKPYAAADFEVTSSSAIRASSSRTRCLSGFTFSEMRPTQAARRGDVAPRARSFRGPSARHAQK